MLMHFGIYIIFPIRDTQLNLKKLIKLIFFRTIGYLWPVAALKSTPQKRFHTKVTFTFNSHF